MPVNNVSLIKTLWPMLFSAKGRLNRKFFIWRIACVWVISGVLYGLSLLIDHAAQNFEGMPLEYLRYAIPEFWPLILALAVAALSILLIMVFLIWWEVVLYIRRLHDLNLSGWWVLVTVPCYFTPLVSNMPLNIGLWVLNLGTLLILCIVRGSRGANRFDADPASYFA